MENKSAALSPKERLLRTLMKQETDRSPVICPGGMMNSAVTEVMKDTDFALPEAHTDVSRMIRLAQAVCEESGFENFGLPFCMTIEAEALGSDVSLGGIDCEAKIDKEAFADLQSVKREEKGTILKNQRAMAVVEAVRYLSENSPLIPVTVTLTGPVSTAASLVDPMTFLKQLRKTPDDARSVLDYVLDELKVWAEALIEAGVSSICLADPTATGEILGPKLFSEYVVTYLNKLSDFIREKNVPVMVHICGQLNRVMHLLGDLRCDALSIDSVVSMRILKNACPETTTMGNLSTYLLENGSPEQIEKAAVFLQAHDVGVIAPACGLGMGTPLENILAFTKAMKAKINT